ncbi:PTS system, glucitol/sorbitol-specific IIA component [Paramixta manurensis]|uniref:PTS system, glucitol/sorbitol-specific IIA component n=1 Tax=Paramixta manurensis TaxID=2740817 RepID=A0A6M8UB01_9GAMM|nr:PTS system, glucitol/sorbitol-specific IIA component [Erwiniaceae bacterium PD-1]
MSALFSATLAEMGRLVLEGLDENMLITFNRDAPEDFLDYVLLLEEIEYANDRQPISGKDYLQLGTENYLITAIGDAAWSNLCQLGHATLIFDGETTPRGYGAIHLEKKSLPEKSRLSGKMIIHKM